MLHITTPVRDLFQSNALFRVCPDDGGNIADLHFEGAGFVGLVQMDMALVETGTLEVQVGDVATIVGADANQRITLNEIAQWSGEVPHEFLTGLGPRLRRVTV